MVKRYPAAFWISLVMHIGLAVVLLFVAYSARFFKKTEERPFELVAGPGDNYEAPEAPQSVPDITPPGPDVDTVEFPELAPLPELPPLPAPPPVIPNPPPTPPRPNPSPIINPDPPRRPPTPPTPPANRSMSYQEYLKKHGNKTTPSQRTANRRTQAPAAPINAPKIDTDNILNRRGANGTATSRDPGNTTEAYFRLLRSRLRDAQEKPRDVSDLLSADVSFRVNPDGKLTEVKIRRSSGNAAFDRSALDSFMRIAIIPNPPVGAVGVHNITFRMREDG